MTLSLIGTIFSAGFILLLIVPGIPTYLSLPSRIALLIWTALGIIFYLISWKVYKNISKEELCKLIINDNKDCT